MADHCASHATTCLAVARPSATQSGIPTPRKPLPVTIETGVPRQRAVDRGHPREVADLVLRVAALEAIHAREHRLAADAEQRRQRGDRALDQRLVRLLQRVRIARAADERAQQNPVLRGAVRPLRRQPRRGEDAGVLDARHHETGSIQRMRDRAAAKGERDGAGRRVRDLAGQARELLVAIARSARWSRTRASPGPRRGRRSRRPSTSATTNGPRPVIGGDAGVQPDVGRDRSRVDQRAHHLAQAAGQRSEHAARIRRARLGRRSEGANDAAVRRAPPWRAAETAPAPTTDRRRPRECRRAAARRGRSWLRRRSVA